MHGVESIATEAFKDDWFYLYNYRRKSVIAEEAFPLVGHTLRLSEIDPYFARFRSN